MELPQEEYEFEKEELWLAKCIYRRKSLAKVSICLSTSLCTSHWHYPPLHQFADMCVTQIPVYGCISTLTAQKIL